MIEKNFVFHFPSISKNPLICEEKINVVPKLIIEKIRNNSIVKKLKTEEDNKNQKVNPNEIVIDLILFEAILNRINECNKSCLY